MLLDIEHNMKFAKCCPICLDTGLAWRAPVAKYEPFRAMCLFCLVSGDAKQKQDEKDHQNEADEAAWPVPIVCSVRPCWVDANQ